MQRRCDADHSSPPPPPSWRCLSFASLFSFGAWVLLDRPWLWEPRQCWMGYPRQPLDDPVRAYYLLEIAFYVSLLFSQLFLDVRRKDFWYVGSISKSWVIFRDKTHGVEDLSCLSTFD